MSKLYFKYGSMNSGKTANLLQLIHNYEENNMKVILIKPSIDTKGNDKVISRIGLSRKVDIILRENDTLQDINFNDISVIFIDEAQFLTEKQVNELYYITKYYDIPVLAYGLRCDFQMNGFVGSTRLLQIADEIEELKSVCKCGEKATQNIRLINNIPTFEGTQIIIDNSKEIKYNSICGKCYLKLKK